MSKLYVSNLVKGCYRAYTGLGNGKSELVYTQARPHVSRWLGVEGSIVIKDGPRRNRFYRKCALDAVAETLGIAASELYSPTALCIAVKYSTLRDTGYNCQLLMQYDGSLTTQPGISLAQAGY